MCRVWGRVGTRSCPSKINGLKKKMAAERGGTHFPEQLVGTEFADPVDNFLKLVKCWHVKVIKFK